MKTSLIIVPFIAVSLWSASAFANCSGHEDYTADVQGNTVTVRPVNASERECGAGETLLREALDGADSGTIVALPEQCEEDSTELAGFVDDCVPPGLYAYGFEEPYDCDSGACSAVYNVHVLVTAALPEDCTPSAEPTEAAEVPWDSADFVCMVDYSEHDNMWGCSVTHRPGSAANLGVGATVLLLGLGLMRRGRAARR
jgi:hypothetical protein